MARAKGKRRKRTKPAGESPAAGRKRLGLQTWEIVVIAALAAAVAWGGWSWWRSGSVEEGFLALAAEGAGRLSLVETPPYIGTGHLKSAGYGDRFPTSGAHDPRWVTPGVYDTPRPATRLVHSLEHGLIVVHVEKPGGDVMATLESWVSLHGGPWSGVVVAPAPGLGEEVVLTAWRKRLRLEEFDAPAAAAFIDRYRGRGPEKPVR